LVVLKSSTAALLPSQLVEQANAQLQRILGEHNPASPPVSLRQMPDNNNNSNEWEENLQVSTVSCLPSALAAPLHGLLSSLPPPSSTLLSIIWICPAPPSEMEPALYGALQRAVSWHKASLLLVSQSEKTPTWLQELGAQVVSVGSLCPCHGLSAHLSSSLLWQGNLAFYHEEADTGPTLLPLGDCQLQAPSSFQLDPHLASLLGPHHLAPDLEVIASPRLSSLPRHLLTPSKVLLVAPEGTEVSSYLTSSLDSPDSALLLRLSYSEDAPRCDQLSTEEWKRRVVDGTWGLHTPRPALGLKLSSHHLLVYKQPLPDHCLSKTHTVFAGVLVSPLASLGDSVHPRLTLGAPGRELDHQLSLESTGGEKKTPVEALLLDLPVISLPSHLVHQVSEWVTRVREEVRRQLPPDAEDAEQVLMAVQEELLKELLENEPGLQVGSRVLQESDFAEAKENLKERDNSASLSEEWQEKRFLRFLEAHDEIVAKEKEKKEGANLLAPPDHDYVVLEAKELMKYFTKEGEPIKELEEVRVSSRRCLQRPQKTKEEYNSFLKDNFDRVAKGDFQFSGFKFKGSNLEGTSFSTMEFTQYHDVYYNTGDGAETQDLECKERKDKLVGMARETGSTISAVAQPQRLKVEKKTSSTSRRSSPRKALVPIASSPLKQVEAKGSLGKPKTELSKVAQHPARRSLVASSSSGANNKDSQKKNQGDDLTDTNRKKLRTAVYESLLRKNIKEKMPLFRPCFAKLFNICKMYVIENQINDPESNSKSSMLEICNVHVGSVIGMETMMSKRKK